MMLHQLNPTARILIICNGQFHGDSWVDGTLYWVDGAGKLLCLLQTRFMKQGVTKQMQNGLNYLEKKYGEPLKANLTLLPMRISVKLRNLLSVIKIFPLIGKAPYEIYGIR
jgi:hypothetical protein